MRLSTLFASLLACIFLSMSPVLADAPGDVSDYEARVGEADVEVEGEDPTAEGELYDLYKAKSALASKAKAAVSGKCTTTALMAGTTCTAGNGASCECGDKCCTAGADSCSCTSCDGGFWDNLLRLIPII